jgi:Ca-activated chloride channel family protein
MNFGDFQFASPWWLLGLALLPVCAWFFAGRGPQPAVRFSGVAPLREVSRPARAGWGGLGRLGWLLALACFFVALARPRLGKTSDFIQSSGVDIMLALDVSGSMYAEDFTLGGERASRIDVVKDVTSRFIAKRPNDRLGIMAFAGQPFLVSPLTLDHGWLQKNLDRLKIGLIKDGTAIGAAIASGANRIKGRPAKSKILLLLTDGDEAVPPGETRIAPTVAAEAARELGIKIYTIAVGTRGKAPYPMFFNGQIARDYNGQKMYRTIDASVDEDSLKEIAKIGNGQFYRATDTASLDKIFAQIDQLEKTEVKLEHKVDWQELFAWFVAAGAALATLQAIWQLTAGRTLP